AVLVVAAFILMPGSGNGKYNVSKPLVADGWPLPLPKPPGSGQSMNALIADGYPLPPPIPPKQGSGVASSSTTVIADGYPLPPPKALDQFARAKAGKTPLVLSAHSSGCILAIYRPVIIMLVCARNG